MVLIIYSYPTEVIKINIGIDIDGVINDLSQFHIACGTKFCYEKKLYPYICASEMDSTGIFKWPNNVDNQFWKEYYTELIFSKNFIRPYAAEVIESLHKNKHTIYIISARNDNDLPVNVVSRSMYQLTTEYLRINHIYYDELILTSDKWKCISKLNIDIMLEDNPTFFAKAVTLSCNLLCFDSPYNKSVNSQNVVRVYSWFDVLNKIEKITKEQK